ncbi:MULTISPECIES: hypothetical protein [unclassified Rhizobium]|uniref:hypothetical protein n=1 Tax=unclassified Rhizobium TaxID=2613769 RepID=UPI001AEA5E2B|nr:MULTISPECIES: hypothetical protein [unclassified Rhizobium]MBP2463312.1 hypothetical protein [Rhizobium sp. PvP014]MBP2530707.1 hypothetical protein [Rhizobium sp. PvP099]
MAVSKPLTADPSGCAYPTAGLAEKTALIFGNLSVAELQAGGQWPSFAKIGEKIWLGVRMPRKQPLIEPPVRMARIPSPDGAIFPEPNASAKTDLTCA